MKLLFLTAVIFTVALVYEGEGGVSHGGPRDNNRKPPHREIKPCQNKNNISAYNKFVHQHILTEIFDRNSEIAWRKYLKASKLCGRVRVQSFIEASGLDQVDQVDQVDQICRPRCRRVRSNLCISESRMKVYHIKSRKSRSCTVYQVKCRRHKVVVACNKVENQCLPVHYEKSRQGNVPC